MARKMEGLPNGQVTRGHVQRFEQIFESMDMRARSKPCHGMKGLVEEAQEAGLAGARRTVEH